MKIAKWVILGVGMFSAGAHADMMQQYYDEGEVLISKFRSCSTIPNQTSAEVGRCLDQSSALISKKTAELKARHKTTISRPDIKSVDFNDKLNQAAKFKQSCTELYPAPLRQHFKNQIKSCQVQIDLNRYFYIYDYVVIFKQG